MNLKFLLNRNILKLNQFNGQKETRMKNQLRNCPVENEVGFINCGA